jgi:hypothetical protein
MKLPVIDFALASSPTSRIGAGIGRWMASQYDLVVLTRQGRSTGARSGRRLRPLA